MTYRSFNYEEAGSGTTRNRTSYSFQKFMQNLNLNSEPTVCEAKKFDLNKIFTPRDVCPNNSLKAFLKSKKSLDGNN